MSERITYTDADGEANSQSVSIIDRLLGALLGMVGIGASILLCPMILYWNLDSTSFWLLFGRSSFNYWLILWSLWTSIVALGAGFAIGYDRMLAFMSHLWFTADEPNTKLSCILWMILLALGAATFGILSSIPASAL